MTALDKTTSLRAFSSTMCRFGEILIDSHMFTSYFKTKIIFIEFIPKCVNVIFMSAGYSDILCFQSIPAA